MAKELTLEEVTDFVNRIDNWQYGSICSYSGKFSKYNAHVQPHRIIISAHGVTIADISKPNEKIIALYRSIDRKYHSGITAENEDAVDSFRYEMAKK